MPKKSELTGLKFGRLLVIEELPNRSKQGSVLWLCLCDCGTTSHVASKELNSQNTTSCGCFVKTAAAVANSTHGMSRTRPYSIWDGMIQRCYNPKENSYKNYGEVGITVCDAWRSSFQNFWDDMGKTYADDLSLERKEPKQGYCHANCEWIPLKEQALNRGIRSNNKTGYTGISEVRKGNSWLLIARLSDPSSGRPVRESRNLNKLPREVAMEQLVAWLGVKRKEFGYKDTHGL